MNSQSSAADSKVLGLQASAATPSRLHPPVLQHLTKKHKLQVCYLTSNGQLGHGSGLWAPGLGMEAMREDAVPVSLQVSWGIIAKFRGRHCAQVKSSQQVGTERCGSGWASAHFLCAPHRSFSTRRQMGFHSGLVSPRQGLTGIGTGWMRRRSTWSKAGGEWLGCALLPSLACWVVRSHEHRAVLTLVQWQTWSGYPAKCCGCSLGGTWGQLGTCVSHAAWQQDILPCLGEGLAQVQVCAVRDCESLERSRVGAQQEA